MRIVIVSQYYAPEPVAIPTTLAEELVRRGHEVLVVTGFPNYPTGELYPGYRLRWRHRESLNGVQILRVPLVPDHSSRAVRRAANYASFAAASATAARAVRGADAVYVYATQMTAALGPSIWRALRGTPYVLHVQDLWPESITGSSLVGKGRSARIIDAVLTPWLRFVYARAAAVIAIAPAMAANLAERGVRPSRLLTSLNWADETSADPGAGESIDIRGSDPHATHVVYAGNLGDLQGLDTAIRAAAALDSTERLRLHLFGSGVAEADLRALAGSLNAANVEFHGRVSRAALSRVAPQSDFQLITLRDLPIMRGTIPSKLQASLRDGVPVITSAAGDVQHLVRKDDLGIAVDPEDVPALTAAFRQAIMMAPSERAARGDRARRVYETTMSMEHGVDLIEASLRSAAQEGRA